MQSTMLPEYDYIVVGQGLAGTVLAFELLKQQQRILIIDNPVLSTTSHVAVGLYNPVVLKKIEKSWLADDLLPAVNQFYAEMEQLLGKPFHLKKDIVKIFTDATEIALWEKRLTEDVALYMSPVQGTKAIAKAVNAGLGFALIHQSGYVDVSSLLREARAYFKQRSCMLETTVDLKQLTVTASEVSYGNATANKIIFCEGHLGAQNPYFNWLPFNPSKGELVVIEIDKIYTEALLQIADKVVNKGVFIVPITATVFKIGATYSWQQLDELPTVSGKTELLEKLSKILRLPFTVIEHKAAIRPNVHDRRPLIGLHPENKNLGIFNGLGSKGVLLAPYFAKQLVSHLLHEQPLHAEADIKRSYKKYKPAVH